MLPNWILSNWIHQIHQYRPPISSVLKLHPFSCLGIPCMLAIPIFFRVQHENLLLAPKKNMTCGQEAQSGLSRLGPAARARATSYMEPVGASVSGEISTELHKNRWQLVGGWALPWKIWTSIGMIITNIWKNKKYKKCSKPPIRQSSWMFSDVLSISMRFWHMVLSMLCPLHP